MPDKIENLPQSTTSDNLAGLMATWRSRDVTAWSRAPENYRALAQKILRQGEPLLAFDVVNEGLKNWPNDIRLRQLQGLALARSGATERANTILENLARSGQSDEETLGMLGRTYKDLAAAADSKSEREKFLRRAAETYAQAFQLSGGYWTGINAATMNLLVGESARATELARKVRGNCLRALETKTGDEYWILAALGEAALILKEWNEAERFYERAAKKAAHRFGDLNSTRRNAHLILQHWNRSTDKIDNLLRVPGVIVFAGHMIDRADRKEPRFPKELEAEVAKQIRNKIEILKPGFGFASAACGSDIIFLEAMLTSGAQISVVLPCAKDQFIRESVDFISGADWRIRFERVLDRAAHVVIASNQLLETGGVSFDYCNQLLLGLAKIQSQRLGADLVSLAVWDETEGDAPGGTASAVQRWRELGHKPEIIDLAFVTAVSDRRIQGRAISKSPRRLETAAPWLSEKQFVSRIVAILFADAVGFSKLSEAEVPRFVEYFLGAIAQLVEKFQTGVMAKNTWGDGLYFVFSDVDPAGKFALELAEVVATTNWEKKALPGDLSLRIALHAGPVYEFDDPITGTRTYSGTHVSRTARIEPITPAGQVYASEAFAALAAAQRTKSFACEYVGQTPMAKGYGTLPTYHVRPIAR